jgi:O-antigen/teichoic acid export membrane protein
VPAGGALMDSKPNGAFSAPPVPVNSVRRNAVLSLAGNGVYVLCQWLLLVVLAHAGSSEMLGVFSLGLAVTAPVMLLTNLQLRNLLASDLSGTYSFGNYLSLRLVCTLVAWLIIAVIALLSHNGTECLVILACAAAKGVEAVSEIVYGLQQGHESFARLSVSLLAKGLLGVAGMAIGLALEGGVVGGTIGLALGWFVVLLAFDLPNAARLVGREQLRPRWQPALLRQLLATALPMGGVAFLLSLNISMPVYFLRFWGSNSDLGHYSAIVYLVTAGNLVVISVGNAAFPRMARYHAEPHYAAFRSLMWRLVAVCAGIGLAGTMLSALIGGFVLSAIYQPEYAEQQHILVWLSAAATFSWIASGFGYGVTAARHLNIQLRLTILASVACLAACLVLIPPLGLFGAAMANLSMSAVLCAGFAFAAMRLTPGPSVIPPLR